MNSRAEQVAAFVLHSRPYRETSALVDLLTLEYGKVTVVARGARRAGSQLRHTLQAFTALAVRFAGKNELKTLHQAETVEVAASLNGNALLCGLYANELIERLLQPLESMPQLFLHYRILLNDLREANDLEVSLRLFEKVLLKELGHWRDLSNCHHAYYRLNQQHELCHVDDSSHAQFTGQQLRAIEHDNFADESTKRAAKRLMRALLQHQLGERPLRSRELFQLRARESQEITFDSP